MSREISRTAIIGMGALGLLYGQHISEKLGKDSVSFILDDERFENYRSKKFTCNGKELDLGMQKSSVRENFDLVIVAVKYNSLLSAIETMKNCVGADTIILSVMNGISSEEIIAEHYGMDKMIFTVAQQMDAMRDGSDLRYTKKGVLCIGKKNDQSPENLETVCRFFDRIELPYIKEENILYRIWAKWMLNVGINQTCAVFDATYSQVLAPGKARDTFVKAMEEVLELSKKEGINLKESEIQSYIDIIASLSPDGFPSMAQDRKAKRKSELEMFAGTVIALAEKHGVNVPANRFLYDEMQKIEAAY